MRTVTASIVFMAGLTVPAITNAQAKFSIENSAGVNVYTYNNQGTPAQFDQAMGIAAGLGGTYVRIPVNFPDYLADPAGLIADEAQYASIARSHGLTPIFEAIMACPDLPNPKLTDPWPTDTSRRTSYVNEINALLAINSGSEVGVGYEPNLAYPSLSSFASYFSLVNLVGTSRKSKSVGRLVGPSVTTYQSASGSYVNFNTFLTAFNNAGCGAYMDSYSIDVYGNSSAGFVPETLILPGQAPELYSVQGFITQTGPKPLVVTETGADTTSVTEADQASLIVRTLLCLNYVGASEVDLYELRDRYDWARPASPAADTTDYHFGLVRNNLGLKPAYLAAQKLIGTFGTYRVTSITSAGASLWEATLVDSNSPPNKRVIKWSSSHSASSTTYPFNPMDAF